MREDAMGVDVSSYQGSVDWQQVAASGISFGFAKASESTTYTDPTFVTNWVGMRAAGLARGAYHFFSTSHPGIDQANHFLSVVGDYGGELPPVLDIETGTPSQAEITAWLNRVEQALGVTPMIYASLSFANEHLGGFGSYPLWVAEYNSHDAPDVPNAWSTWTFRQYSQSGSVAGIDGNVDLDRHNGPLGSMPSPTTAAPSSEPPASKPAGSTSLPDTSVSFSGTPWVISAGDTLSAISQRVGVNVAALAAANDISPDATLHVGQTLTIP